MTNQPKSWNPTPAQEELFARLAVWLGSPWEAARRVGAPADRAEEAAHTLLANRSVIQKIERYQKELEEMAGSFALGGLFRLATYSGAGGLRLALGGEALSGPEAERLDLFGVSALKWSEKGCEVKFFDRMPALALLSGWEKGKPGAGPADFLNALRESAAKLSQPGEEEGGPEDV